MRAHSTKMKPTGSGNPISRRGLVGRAAVLAAIVAAAPARLVAGALSPDQEPLTTPMPGAPTTSNLPLPSTLAADASPEFRAVAEALVAAMREYQVPGTALGILAGDREEHATFGVASVSSLRAVTPVTLFPIASVTKTFTATAIWRLIDAGALALDAPVRSFLPDLQLQDAGTAATVTVANLLDHSAGWYGEDWGFDTGSDDGALARYVAERLPDLPQMFPCGSLFSYNNAAFTLLGRLIEVATGSTYNAAMQSLLFGPLGLADTLLERDAVLARPYADGHAVVPINGRDAVAVQTPLWPPRSNGPAGGIWSTTRDVLRYARLHLGASVLSGPASIVRPESLKRMQTVAMPVPGLPLSMGRSWFIQEVGGIRAIMHDGDAAGQHTQFLIVPGQQFAFILCCNAQPGGQAAQDVLDEALARYPGLGTLSGRVGVTHAVLADADAPTITLTPEALASYAGRYVDPAETDTVTTTTDGLEMTSLLTAEPGTYSPAIQPVTPDPPQPVPLSFLAPDLALAGRVKVPFARDASGQVGWIGSGLRLRPRTGPV
jgi:CubicO group peptidase (beta-lactamase class C family)